jgi:prolyl-tRNA editing enzyme YbaK/EbsC (Cys-tRNA(Pro) deacylase)
MVRDANGFALAVLPACCTLDLDRLKGLMGHGTVTLPASRTACASP